MMMMMKMMMMIMMMMKVKNGLLFSLCRLCQNSIEF